MELEIPVKNQNQALKLLGTHDGHVRLLRETFEVDVVARPEGLVVRGPQTRARAAGKVLEAMLERVRSGDRLGLEEVKDLIAACATSKRDTDELAIDVFARGMKVLPRTPGQRKYVRAVQKKHLVFCIGPAGTGKTYLAVAIALQALKTRQVRKIVLARPAVEAGEKLGFLPGDMQAKVNPYLRPLYDALSDMMEFGQLRKYMENDMVEVIPLAYMRGRTLNHAFIILDEAQNCTTGQMKMCLTRLGEDSRGIVTGDITQIDLPTGQMSGLVAVQSILSGVRGIEFIYLKSRDIVRHRLVQDIVNAYGRSELREDRSGGPDSAQPEGN
ncbi:MAG: phosphate starvation-inducible protein PhoH [Planctomycetes bacterium SM23_65]|nr:MAG: phosphate starvation-inducible protein PhoH [Planctomycetes bacterium SM23_65]